MKTFNIEINKSHVFRQLAMNTAYRGVKHPTPSETYDRVAVVDADKPLLDTFLRESLIVVERALTEYIRLPTSEQKNIVTLCLEMPSNYDEHLQQTLKIAVEHAIAVQMMAKWVAITLPEAEPYYETLAAQQIALLERVISDRKRPLPPAQQEAGFPLGTLTQPSFVIDRDQLLYDIANNAYLMAHARNDETHGRHLAIDITEGQNRDRIDSTLNLAYRQLCDILAPYLDHCRPPVDIADFVFVLRKDPAIGSDTVGYWSVLAKEFLTAAVLADWLVIACPDLAGHWQHRLDDVRHQLAVSLSVRKRKPHKRMEVV